MQKVGPTNPPRGEYDLMFRDIGRKTGRPFKPLLIVGKTAFGDVLNAIVMATKIAAQFENVITTIIMNLDRPYKRELLRLFPYNLRHAQMKEMNGVIPVDLLNPFARFTTIDDKAIQSPYWHDIIIPTNMISDAFCWDMDDSTLRIPPDLSGPLSQQLIDLGLDPQRWYCTLHYREPNYQYKQTSNIRDVDAAAYQAVSDHIIDKLGGQVVRLGHPEMRQFPARKGLVDLALIPDSYLLQANAVSRSRFFIGSPSGALIFALGFSIPTAITDSSDFWCTPITPSVILTHTVVTPDGTKLRQQELMDAGLLNTRQLTKRMQSDPRYQLIKCNAEDIARAADAIFAATSDVQGWRPERFIRHAPTNVMRWPPRVVPQPSFM
jgi:putative glycosyltransferase (TIGR04372 family)